MINSRSSYESERSDDDGDVDVDVPDVDGVSAAVTSACSLSWTASNPLHASSLFAPAVLLVNRISIVLKAFSQTPRTAGSASDTNGTTHSRTSVSRSSSHK